MRARGACRCDEGDRHTALLYERGNRCQSSVRAPRSLFRCGGGRGITELISTSLGPIFWKFQSRLPATNLRKAGSGARTCQSIQSGGELLSIGGRDVLENSVGTQLAMLSAQEDRPGVHAIGDTVGRRRRK